MALPGPLPVAGFKGWDSREREKRKGREMKGEREGGRGGRTATEKR